ncbi:hypothetical protein PVL30_001186 [Lodderomyces elongisporus]|uniref:uncharacterized protein n=1 Tax=Lodderomyces elongisporus TaxID=36914 RepID=UPI00291F1B3A|nr:uncharacterized protein PVL30_001186 [Lodderomyces elongisporus]WLF77468.1 hypothetical protein PVL30_001186 [Lodderomyces elongisporus]
MVLFESINRLANPNTGVGLTGSRRRRIFVPPSTQRPLFIYGEGDDQRSFLSLIETGSEFGSDQDVSDAASVSTSRSLPESLGSVQTTGDQESFQSWLVEEHHRRLSAAASPEEDSDNGSDLFQDRRHGGGGGGAGGAGGGRRGRRTRRRSSSMSSKTSSHLDFMKLKTNPSHEAKVLLRHASPLIITFILEHFFSIVCLIVVGKLGTNELAAVSLATMTTTITFAIFEGTATALDTLCPQAYGAGNYELMSIFVQRSYLISLTLYIPCGLFWWFSASVLKYIIDNPEVVELTSKFLRILILGAPGYIFFENGKRFLQAQGIFEASTGIMFISAPVNILMSWFLVWNDTYGLGYIGAPISSVFNFWLMSLLLVLYVKFIDGKKCWFGIASPRELISHWSQVIHLALPGIIMIESEYLAYEIMTLFASYFGTKPLAAQSAVSSIASLAYMIPFAVSIATSTRVANFIGGQNLAGALTATRIGWLGGVAAASVNGLILFTFRYQLAKVFTDDPDVIELIEKLLHPLVAILQIFDGTACVSSGILRAQGAQKLGGLINFVAYYAFALPLALILSKIVGWGLYGLWIGIGSGMFVIALTETSVIAFSDWEQILLRAGLLDEDDDDDDDDYYDDDEANDRFF